MDTRPETVPPPAPIRVFRSNDTDVDAIANVFAEHINFMFDMKSDVTEGRRCEVRAPWYECRGEPTVDRVCDRHGPASRPVDGLGPVMLGSSICLSVATQATLPPSAEDYGRVRPYFGTWELYRHSAQRLDAYASDFPEWARDGETGYLPFGFHGMDPCWVFRIISSLDPLTVASPDATDDWEIRHDLGGLPALICSPSWLGAWTAYADWPGRDGIRDGWVTEQDVAGWSDLGGWPPLPGWSGSPWNRDLNPEIEGCADYVDGDDPGSTCNAADFDFWNRVTAAADPEAESCSQGDYVSVEDLRLVGWDGCPFSRYGIGRAFDIPEMNFLVLGVAPGDYAQNLIYFAPGDPDAYCTEQPPPPGWWPPGEPWPPPGVSYKVVPPHIPNATAIDARWVDVDGRPALRFDVRLGLQMDFTAWFLFAHRRYELNSAVLHVTLQPRLCGSLAPGDFCVNRKTEGGSGDCRRTLAAPADGRPLCGPEFRRDGWFPDAMGDELEWGRAADDRDPEPLDIVNNGILFGLDVGLDISYTADDLCAPLDILCFMFFWLPDLLVEPRIREAEADIGASMFNAIARALYVGLPTSDGGAMDPAGDFAAANQYIQRWFWEPARKLLRRVDHTHAPELRNIRFTDIRWARDARGERVAEFEFIWDGDNDEVDDDVDNCPGTYNPRQEDLDRDGVGDACEGDVDGDRCCEGCATGPGARDCVCGNNSSDDHADCERVELPGGGSITCFDEETTSLWLGSDGPPDRDGDTVPNDCDRDDDGDEYPDGEDGCPLVFDDENLDWSPSSPADPRGNICDDDDDDDGCQDRTECRFRDYEPEDPMQPCGRYACVDGQCRTATAEGEVDGGSYPCGYRWDAGRWIPRCEAAFEVGGERIDGTCMWDPTRAEPYYCDLPSRVDPPFCEFLHPPPFGGEPPAGGGPGIPGDMYVLEDLAEGFWTITDVIPCPGAIGCCWNAHCNEPEVNLTDEFGNVLNTLHVAQATGLDASAFREMQVAVVRDINGNRVHDVAISAPYAAGEDNTVRGKVFTFDGATFRLLRIREQPGAFGEALGRVEGGLAARVRSPFWFDERATDLSAAADSIRTGVVITDGWGMESAFVPDPKDAYGTFVERITPGWIRDRELAVVYSPTCRGLTDVGCLTGYDQYGTAAWELRGWQSGNEFGASFDSDGDYAVVGVPGYNQGTGGMVRVIDLRRNRAWNITQRNRVTDFGRHVAIVESAAGPRIVASMRRDGAPRVVQMTLSGQILREHGLPNTWEVVGLVSPTRGDGTTDARYAIVYRTDDGWVMHQWFRATAERAR